MSAQGYEYRNDVRPWHPKCLAEHQKPPLGECTCDLLLVLDDFLATALNVEVVTETEDCPPYYLIERPELLDLLVRVRALT